MKTERNNLDEMQEQKLLKLEHHATWLAFWGLLSAILIQIIIGGENLFQNIIGEWIVFICICIYILIGCMKYGIWDRKLKPNFMTNIIISAISGIVCAITFSISSYLKYQDRLTSIATGFIMFLSVFILALAAVSFFSWMYKKRLKKLEEKADEE